MIYEQVAPDHPIEQGDIFRDIPRIDLNLGALDLITEDSQRIESDWKAALARGGPVVAALRLRPVMGIVITQNCDAVRAKNITLSQIDPYLESIGQKDPPKDAKGWQSLLVRMARTNPRLFYLPADTAFGLPDRMAADFQSIVTVPRLNLEAMRDRRIGRLNATATDHFRESLGQFFRRYAYNEWYPFTKDELSAYQAACKENVQPYPWQG